MKKYSITVIAKIMKGLTMKRVYVLTKPTDATQIEVKEYFINMVKEDLVSKRTPFLSITAKVAPQS
jgi:GTP cyclohydrolase II